MCVCVFSLAGLDDSSADNEPITVVLEVAAAPWEAGRRVGFVPYSLLHSAVRRAVSMWVVYNVAAAAHVMCRVCPAPDQTSSDTAMLTVIG